MKKEYAMTIYDFTVKDAAQNDVSLSQYRGKVLLVVNTATKCGLTPQYEALEALYKKYGGHGLEILDFPCNQFLAQAPGTDEEISSFCTLNYGTTFPRFAKIDINGSDAAPLYDWLKEQKPTENEDAELSSFVEKLRSLGQKVAGSSIKWNFTKFLIDRDGNVAARFAPTRKPEEMAADIESLLDVSPDGMVCAPEFPDGCM